MRHGKKFNHLGRKPAHRKAMLSNMASSLIMEKRISTTVAKAKALRKYVEPLLTKSKTDDTNSRRVVFSYLQNKESVSELFNEVADKIATRPGGYTRILKTGHRLGDNADMCVIELVDYNELLLAEAKPEKAKTRRSRRGKGGSTEEKPATKTTETVEAVAPETVEDVVEEAVVEEEQPAEVVAEAVTEEAVVEEATEEVVEEPEEQTAEVEEVVAEETIVEEVSEEEVVAEEVEEEPAPEVEEDTAEEPNEEDSSADDATEEEDKKE
jgi:large subunit ribosomal protein L17